MKQMKLDKEEQSIMDAIERDEYVLVTGKEAEAVAQAIAARKRDAEVILRVNSQDMKKIRQKTKKMGISYKLYLSEVIHKVAQMS
jgi:predicted DNA binding CopG/RHH family protein